MRKNSQSSARPPLANFFGHPVPQPMRTPSIPPEVRRGTIVITGASAGVGRACAQSFARDGARVGLIARDQQALDKVRVEVEVWGCAFCSPANAADAVAFLQPRRQLRTHSDRSRFRST